MRGSPADRLASFNGKSVPRMLVLSLSSTHDASCFLLISFLDASSTKLFMKKASFLHNPFPRMLPLIQPNCQGVFSYSGIAKKLACPVNETGRCAYAHLPVSMDLAGIAPAAQPPFTPRFGSDAPLAPPLGLRPRPCGSIPFI